MPNIIGSGQKARDRQDREQARRLRKFEAERLADAISLRTKDAAHLTTQEWAWAAKDADVPTPVSQITRELVIEKMLDSASDLLLDEGVI